MVGAMEKEKGQAASTAWPLGLKSPVGGEPPVVGLFRVSGGRSRLRRHRFLFLRASSQTEGADGYGNDHDQFDKFHS